MIQSWQFILIFTVYVQSLRQEADLTDDWRIIEAIAEQYSYVVALLKKDLNASCTGTILGEDLVLTSGSCVTKKLHFVLLGTAIIDKADEINSNSVQLISRTILHADYALEMKLKTDENELSITGLSNNIGLVFTVEPVLELFHERAKIGSFLASDLIDKRFSVVGFGSIQKSRKALQREWYQQTPCLNPKWYDCVCGLEHSTVYPSSSLDFGDGAPVVYGSEVVAVTALPCGTLFTPNTKNKYNVFTVIAPYVAWIVKQRKNFKSEIQKFSTEAKNKVNDAKQSAIRFVYIFLLVIKLLL